MMTKDVEFRPDTRTDPAPPSQLGFVENPSRPVIARILELDSGFVTARHAHPRGQLALCYNGLMRLDVGEDAWFTPDRHGVWIPPGLEHQLTTQTAVELHNLFIDQRFVARSGLPARPTVVRATPLLRGIARRLAPDSDVSLSSSESRRLSWVALDEMARLETPDLRLPGARDPRLMRAMEHMLGQSGTRQGQASVARAAGVSERTLARLFLSETGLTFRDWRRRMRFMLALEALDRGETSTAIAGQLGYSSPSAFTVAFRRQFGAPPSVFRKRS